MKAFLKKLLDKYDKLVDDFANWFENKWRPQK